MIPPDPWARSQIRFCITDQEERGAEHRAVQQLQSFGYKVILKQPPAAAPSSLHPERGDPSPLWFVMPLPNSHRHQSPKQAIQRTLFSDQVRVDALITLEDLVLKASDFGYGLDRITADALSRLSDHFPGRAFDHGSILERHEERRRRRRPG